MKPMFPVLMLGLATLANAQTTPATPAAPAAAATPAEAGPTKDEVSRYATQLTDRIEKRMERATAMVNEIMTLDRSVQKSVDQILAMLRGMTDSPESRTRVAQTKRDMIARLGKAAEYYARTRAGLEEELRRSDNPFRKEDLFKERAAFDQGIDKMIQSAVGLALSMDTHEENEKYLVEGSDSDGWGWDLTYRDNPAYEQNRRAVRQTNAAVKDIDEALDKATQRLELKSRELRESLRATDLDPERRKTMEAELKRTEALRVQRAEQEAMLNSQSSASPGKAVGLSEAIRSEKFIEELAQDARRDFIQMMSRYRDLRVERDAIAKMRAQLDQAEEWLKTNAAQP